MAPHRTAPRETVETCFFFLSLEVESDGEQEYDGTGQSRTFTTQWGGAILETNGWRPKTCMPMSYKQSYQNRILVE